ncbi:MAG TPA: hypothetical protein VIG57_07685 [Candidatus Entotheonella sp.]
MPAVNWPKGFAPLFARFLVLIRESQQPARLFKPLGNVRSGNARQHFLHHTGTV